jgi:L-asparaginase
LTAACLIAAMVPNRAMTATPDLPRVVILATGGTIAGAQPKEGDPGYKAGSLSVESLIAAAPGVDKLARLEGEQIASIGSQDMNDVVWFKLAKRANELLSRPDIAGIVVTHGTDTLEETGFFLDLVLKSDKPVVLVGSMRPSTAVSADGPLNLYNAVAVASDPEAKGRGVLVVMNDQIHAAHSLTKTSTTAVQTFMSPVRGIVGVASYGKNDWYSTPPWKHTTATEFDITNVTTMPRVDVIFASMDMSPEMINSSAASGAKGIVIAGVGNGNMNKASVDAAAAAVKKGVVVVRSSRVATGLVGRNVELEDDKLGFVASDELNPQKARILLSLALLKGSNAAAIQKMFQTY